MPQAVALIPVNLDEGGLGLPSRVGRALGGRLVLAQTVSRVAQVRGVDKVVVVHRPGAPVRELAGDHGEQVAFVEVADALWDDDFTAMRRVARRWAPRAWRGGPGGMTCYDELLPAAPLAAALEQVRAESALLVGPDWPWIDIALCGDLLKVHLHHPAEMPMVFSQAAPGLAGIAVSTAFLRKLADSLGSGFGPTMAYRPSSPQADPIGKDVCVQVPPIVRDCPARFIYDHPDSVAMMDALAQCDRASDGAALLEAGAAALAEAARRWSAEPPAQPQWVRLEITPRRLADGPIVAQHHVTLERDDMDRAAAREIIEQVATWEGCPLMLGGLGDPLLHEHFAQIVKLAHDAGVCSTAIETDLLCDDAILTSLLDLPIDVVVVRLNADSPRVYEQVMGSSAYDEVMGRIERLLNERNRRVREDGRPAGVPWVMPQLVKTSQTLGDMERFYDRWTHYAGHAVIAPAQAGRSAAGDDLSALAGPVPMAPPHRVACRQLETRMTILSDGRVAGCDQDWLGGACVATDGRLADAWAALMARRALHREGRHQELALCAGCTEWHRP